jgi:hypothetical protein
MLYDTIIFIYDSVSSFKSSRVNANAEATPNIAEQQQSSSLLTDDLRLPSGRKPTKPEKLAVYNQKLNAILKLREETRCFNNFSVNEQPTTMSETSNHTPANKPAHIETISPKNANNHNNSTAGKRKKNPKRLFAYINSKQKVRSIISSLLVNDKEVTEPIDIANSLNNQFKSVFVNDTTRETPEFTQRTQKTIETLLIDENIVKEELLKLQTNKSCGIDGLHPAVLKQCASSLAKPLTMIFNQSFNSITLPTAWLQAIVTPLHKKGNKQDPSNYRPISLTSIACKIMERIVKTTITKHLEDNNLINNSQHGFEKKKLATPIFSKL